MTSYRYSIYSKNDLSTPVAPNDPGFTFDPITKVEGLKLINIYKGNFQKKNGFFYILPNFIEINPS